VPTGKDSIVRMTKADRQGPAAVRLPARLSLNLLALNGLLRLIRP